MNYIGTTINESSVITATAGADLTNAAFLAVKFDAEGNVVLCGDGENAIGILTAETPEAVAKGDGVTVQIKNVGMAKAGAAVTVGAEVAVDAAGKLIPAVASKFIVGIALSAAAADGVFNVDICKCGYKA